MVKNKLSDSRKLKKAQGDNVAKKVKKISSKVMGLRGKKVIPGPASHNNY